MTDALFAYRGLGMAKILELINTVLRKITTVINRIQIRVLYLYNNKPTQSIFRLIYKSNAWGHPESVSGPGSSLEATSNIRDQIPVLLHEIDARSLLDAPCGDFNWMKEINLNIDRYIGIDIVQELIKNNIDKYASKTRSFYVCDLIHAPLPQVDVILCRDCLVHLPFKDIKLALNNFKKSGSIYLLTTSFSNLVNENVDITTGEWRPINFEKSPFNFPKPLKIIDEDGVIYHGKRLVLWEISQL